MASPAAAIGLRVKTGKAIAIVVRGTPRAPEVLKRDELILADHDKPDTWQPYHPVMELAWTEAQKAVRPIAQIIEKTARKAMAALVAEVRAAGYEVRGIGIAGRGSQDPARIGNTHIRAHAAEGRLFREVLESGADACGIAKRVFLEKEIYQKGAPEIGCSAHELKTRVAALRTPAVRPWSAEERCAALAAWLMLK
ncbi:MAG: hypothetical protein ACRD8O_01350 [Bryobacteraceae bacterium]